MSLWSYKKLPPYFNRVHLVPTASKAGWKVNSASAGTRYGEVLVAIKNLLVKNSAPYPTFAATQPATAHYVTGQTFTLVVVPSVAVGVSGLPSVALTIGAFTRQAVYNPLTSTPTALHFDYTFVTADVDMIPILIAHNIVPVAGYGVTFNVSGLNSEIIPDIDLIFPVISNSGVTVN